VSTTAGTVVVFGSLSQDLHLGMSRHPRSGETVMSGDIEYRFGGKGANQAIAAAAAGAASVFIGKVGDDPHGREYVDRLGRFGVDTSTMEIVPGSPTGTAIIYLDSSGENMIVVAPGANFRMGHDDLAKLAGFGAGDVLLMPLELPLHLVAAAARQAAGQGMRVILNLAPYAELPADVLALCDPVIANEHEAELLDASGTSAESLLVTLGANGSRWGEHEVAAVTVQPVDTTGAGDAYCGTLAARLALGEKPEQAMTAASRAAADCVLHHGAQPDLATD
jgi:ribokinase